MHGIRLPPHTDMVLDGGVDENGNTSTLAALVLHLATEACHPRQLGEQAIEHTGPCFDHYRQMMLPDQVNNVITLDAVQIAAACAIRVKEECPSCTFLFTRPVKPLCPLSRIPGCVSALTSSIIPIAGAAWAVVSHGHIIFILALPLQPQLGQLGPH